jgi:hypothetical protein
MPSSSYIAAYQHTAAARRRWQPAGSSCYTGDQHTQQQAGVTECTLYLLALLRVALSTSVQTAMQQQQQQQRNV